MEPPQIPIDIKIEMGSEAGTQNLINIDIQFSDDKQKINFHKEDRSIKSSYTGQFCLIFDLYTQKGRQKQAIDYINQQKDKGLSPLQIIFSNKPEPDCDFCKLSIQPHQGFIRLNYHFYPNQDQLSAVNLITSSFSNNGLRLQSQINLQMKGKLSHTNNNRTNVLVDYTKFHLISNAFCSQKLIKCLLDSEDFQNNFHYYINNPFFELVKKSKVAKMNVKMDSFRKVSKYYGKVAYIQKQPQVKQFKYFNRGIFRQKAELTFIYNDQYMINVITNYESQDAFIRLIKVYSKFVESTFDCKIYKDD